MDSTEDMSERLKMVDMHDYFIKQIDKEMKEKEYITACWLIYSCLENRYFRTVKKLKRFCDASSKSEQCKSEKNKIALSTKIHCIKRLYDNNVSCIHDTFEEKLFDDTINWIKKRNELMHNLLSLEEYKNCNEEFKKCAKDGKRLLTKTYTACTAFRKEFYDKNYKFEFPERAMKECRCGKGRDECDNNTENKKF